MVRESAVEVVPGVGARINALLFEQRKTRTWLSEASEVSRQTLNVALSQDRISRKNASKLAAALGVDVDDILTVNYDQTLEQTLEHAPTTEAGRELEDFFGSVERVIRTLSNQTGDKAMDPKSKLAILNGIEEAARLAGQKLPPEYWRLRESVLSGD